MMVIAMVVVVVQVVVGCRLHQKREHHEKVVVMGKGFKSDTMVYQCFKVQMAQRGSSDGSGGGSDSSPCGCCSWWWWCYFGRQGGFSF